MKTVKILRTIIMIAAALLAAATAGAQTAREYFALGNNAYKAGDYARALENYSLAEKNGFDSAELYFNKANAFAKLDRRGDALLNYKRAVYNAPRMREATANLAMYAKDNSLESGLEAFKTPLIAELSESEWATVCFVSFWAAVLLVFVPPLYGKRPPATLFLAIVFAAAFAVAIPSILDWRNFADTAVALKPDTKLAVSPTKTAPAAAIVDAGQCAKILKSRGGYLYLETKNGKRGWAASADFAPTVE